MKKFLPILFSLLSCYSVLMSQDYPVQVTTIVSPPYSLYLSDYASPESNSLQVMLQLKELDRPEYRVKLRLTIEGQGITLRTKPTYVPRALVLQGGVPEMLTGADLSAYLNPNNMDFLGTTQQAFMRTGMFPEGFYTFKVEVLDYVRNVVVSNAGIGNAFIILNDPPLINLPFNNDKVIATDPQNVIFSWTPRHTASPNAAFSTEYEFTLVELYPENRNPNDAIRAANSIYTTTTTTTSLNYGIIEPLLIPGRKYAFRIRAYDVSGKDLFKNNGYSEVNVFQFGDACVVPLNVQANPLDPVRIKFSWEQQDVHTGYSLEFRKEGASNWEQQSTFNQDLIVPGLSASTTYEYRVQGQCGTIQGPFSTLATVLTPDSDSSAFVCGAPMPEIEINTTPLDRNLRLLDIIKTADFEVIVTEVTANGDGTFKGTGRAIVPWFKLAGVRVKFSNIKVNEELRVFSGNVTTIYSKDSRFVLSADLSRDDATAPDSGSPAAPPAFTGIDTVLTIPITNVTLPVNTSPVIVITTPDGQTFEIPRERNEDGDFEDTRITDSNGDTWTVSSAGDIQRGPNVAPPDALASRDSVNFRVNFAAVDNQFYGFDPKHFTDVPQDKITINDEDYWIAWKSVETGRQDYVQATAPNENTFPSSVGFKTDNAPAIHETGSSAAFRRVSVMGLVDQQVESLTAYVRVQAEGQEQAEEVEVGRLNVKAYDKVNKKAIIVPVNGVIPPAYADISRVLNEIYAQAVVGWDVEMDAGFTIDDSYTEALDSGESGLLASFFPRMLPFIRTFRNEATRFVDGNAYYIFLVNSERASDQGFMPFNRQFGFVFVNNTGNDPDDIITAIAHELGHGAFNFRHTFSPQAPLAGRGTTDNLMDYDNGRKLKKFQWDLVRNEETINGWFEDDSESAMSLTQALFAGYKDFSNSHPLNADIGKIFSTIDNAVYQEYKNDSRIEIVDEFPDLRMRGLFLVLLPDNLDDKSVQFIGDHGITIKSNYDLPDDEKKDYPACMDNFNCKIVEIEGSAHQGGVRIISGGNVIAKAFLISSDERKKITVELSKSGFAPTSGSLIINYSVPTLVTAIRFHTGSNGQMTLGPTQVTSVTIKILNKENRVVMETTSMINSLMLIGTYSWNGVKINGERVSVDDFPLHVDVNYVGSSDVKDLDFDRVQYEWDIFNKKDILLLASLQNYIETRGSYIARLTEIGVSTNVSPIDYLNEHIVAGDFLGIPIQGINIRYLYALRKVEEQMGRSTDWSSSSTPFAQFVSELRSQGMFIQDAARMSDVAGALSDHGTGFAFDFKKESNIWIRSGKNNNIAKYIQLVTGAKLMEQSYSAEESKLFHTNFLKRVSDLNITKANVKATFNTYQSLEETDLNYLKADVIFGPLRLEAEDFIERLGQSKIIGTTSVFLDLRSSLLSYCDSHFENILNLEEKARSMQDFITIANKTLILNYDYTNEFVEVVRIGAEYESKINAFKGVIDEIKNSFSSEGDWNSNISNWLAKIGAISHKDYTQSLDKIYKAIITKKSILGNSYSEFGNNLHYELHNLPSYYGTKLFEVGFFSLDINVVNQILNKSVQTPSGTIKITWGGHYGGSKDFMHFEIKPNPGDRRYQTYLGTISMTTIKEYLNSFKTESGLNYNY